MTIADELDVVRERLARLEDGPAVIGDWHRLEARIARALVHGCNHCAAQRELDELRVLRLLVQSRLQELAA